MYKPWDTALRVQDGKDSYMPGPMDKRVLFLASDDDNRQYHTLNGLGTIERYVCAGRTSCVQVMPELTRCQRALG